MNAKKIEEISSTLAIVFLILLVFDIIAYQLFEKIEILEAFLKFFFLGFLFSGVVCIGAIPKTQESKKIN